MLECSGTFKKMYHLAGQAIIAAQTVGQHWEELSGLGPDVELFFVSRAKLPIS